ncbi:MAG: hypothetical protein GX654_12145 [Desulfatiglans sp.]|jgi:predicted transcriptional regulator|nr:hypothetical protein [Desulfatiglans sp.]
MRTTIEISDNHRSALLSIAAQKGHRGYSKIIEDAIEHYIADQTKTVGIKNSVLAMKGSWKKEAEEIKANIKELRKNWKKS